ncbi:succinate dehydrogenase, cytochrome b556 subunit [Candidatus Pelagibacter sp.]|nr:succinate dehydrogenase, cytochrome b556 subunit [Candidatus Pelagibacter sp.]
MENKSPLSPHIQIYRWHISSLVSISHRITGIINIVAITLICIWVSLLVLGDTNYNLVNQLLNSILGKFIALGLVWSLVEQFFSNKNFNVLSIDLPGHGNSDGPCLNSIENIADWLEKVFVKLKLDQVILVGHSQGCLEMLEYSNKYKSRLQKLVFMGGSYKMPVNQDLIDLAENGDPDAVKLMMKWCYEGSKKFIGGNPIKRIIQSPKDIRKILAVDLVACNNYLNGSNAVKTIDCPSMFVFGALDKMVNIEVGKKFANMVENSTTHIIDGCGHMIMIEKAFEIREKVLEFLQK